MSVVTDKVLGAIPDPALRVDLVWVPVLDEDERPSAEVAAGRVRDSRVRQWWDEGRKLGDALGEVLRIPRRDGEPGFGFAWDVYLVYAPGTRWTAGAPPPAPDFWTHQLSQVDPAIAPLRDGEQLRDQLRARLTGTAPRP